MDEAELKKIISPSKKLFPIILSKVATQNVNAEKVTNYVKTTVYQSSLLQVEHPIKPISKIYEDQSE